MYRGSAEMLEATRERHGNGVDCGQQLRTPKTKSSQLWCIYFG